MTSLPAGRLVFIGLDACDPGITQQWMDEGHLPALARLRETGARCGVRSPFGFFVNAMWPAFSTGMSVPGHGFHASNYIDAQTYERRILTPPVKNPPTFWNWLTKAGKRVCVIDVPHTRIDEPVNGVMVAEYGVHDRHHGFHTWPREKADQIRQTYGLHPVYTIDPTAKRDFAADDLAHRAGHDRTPDEEIALLRDTLAGLKTKTRLSCDLLKSERWDLFVSIYGESHGSGHQQWHLHDPTHPRFNADLQRRMGGDPILQVWQALDEAVQAHLDLCTPEDTVFVYLSHGMGPHYDGAMLLEEVLMRLDGRGPRGGGAVGVAARSMPARLQRLAGALGVPAPIRRKLSQIRDRRLQARLRSRARFFVSPVNTAFSGVRLNLVGREAKGRVRPEEADSVLSEVEAGLMALRNVDTGEPVIKRVVRTDVHNARSPDDLLPDLLLEWSRAAPIDAVRSDQVGLVRAQNRHWRTGDHRMGGVLLAVGPGFAPGSELPAIDTQDLAPTLVARLGVPFPDVDGKPVPWLAEASRMRAASSAPVE